MSNDERSLWDDIPKVVDTLDRSDGASPDETTRRILRITEKYHDALTESRVLNIPNQLADKICDVIVAAAVAAYSVARDLDACRRAHATNLADAVPGVVWFSEWEVAEIGSNRPTAILSNLLLELGLRIDNAARCRIGQGGQTPRKGTTHDTDEVVAALTTVIVVAQSLLVKAAGSGVAARDHLAAKTTEILIHKEQS